MRVYGLQNLSIRKLIKEGKCIISIVGLGYVGLHLFVSFVRKGAHVIGVDIDQRKINLITQGICPIKISALTENFKKITNSPYFSVTTDAVEAAKNSHIHIIIVPTPADKGKLTDLSAVIDASIAVGKGLKKGDLVILESTVYPGATDGIVKPLLERESKLKAGEDFGLVHCSERIDPGNIKHRLDNTPRVIGGIDKESAEAATMVYSFVTDAELVKVRDCKTAEIVKLLENVYRDINIAFINEVSLLCEKLGIDVLEVLDAASTKWSFYPHVPGVGVGGHCLPNNPYYLLKVSKDTNSNLELVRLARRINDMMPHHTVKLITEALNEVQKPIKGSKIAVLGIAYKSDVDDFRNTPAIPVVINLSELGANVVVFDPFIKGIHDFYGAKVAKSLEKAIQNSDCITLITDHSLFKKLTPNTIAKLCNMPAAIVDGRHVFKPIEVKKAGIVYRGVGRNEDSKLNLSNVRFMTRTHRNQRC